MANPVSFEASNNIVKRCFDFNEEQIFDEDVETFDKELHPWASYLTVYENDSTFVQGAKNTVNFLSGGILHRMATAYDDWGAGPDSSGLGRNAKAILLCREAKIG